MGPPNFCHQWRQFFRGVEITHSRTHGASVVDFVQPIVALFPVVCVFSEISPITWPEKQSQPVRLRWQTHSCKRFWRELYAYPVIIWINAAGVTMGISLNGLSVSKS